MRNTKEHLSLETIRELLLENAREVCEELLPAGKHFGSYYKCGSINGEVGGSLYVYYNTGYWIDEADPEETNRRDLIELWRRVRGLSFAETLAEIEEWLAVVGFESDRQQHARELRAKLRARGTGVNDKGSNNGDTGCSSNDMHPEYTRWPDCVLNFDETEMVHLMGWRAWRRDFCWWLKANNLIGILVNEKDKMNYYAFPVVDEAGRVVRVNYRVGEKDWSYDPPKMANTGRPSTFAFVISPTVQNGEVVDKVFLAESTWDGLTLVDRMDLYKKFGWLVIITRGTSGRLPSKLFELHPPVIYLLLQNDQANLKWRTKVLSQINWDPEIFLIRPPKLDKDYNDWIRREDPDLAASNELVDRAELYEVPKTVEDEESGKSKKSTKTKSIHDYGIVHHVFENAYYENKGNVWGPTNVDDIRRELKVTHKIPGEETDKIIVRIRKEAQIYQAINVAGYKSGIHRDKFDNPYLVTRSHKMVSPVQGDWSIIREIIDSMFGAEQSPYIHGWLQWAYLSFEECTLAPGQLLVLVGPNNCGKTLFQEKVISRMLGSNSVKCLRYLMGTTEFNEELISNAHWVLSDSISELDWRERKTFTENSKEILVNSEQRLRALYANALTVDMCPRISCSINPNSIAALPIFEEGMSDKMILIKANKSSILPDDKLPRLEFEARIKEALPGYAYYLRNEYEVPDDIKEAGNTRFGIRTYHHAEILEMISDVKRHVYLAEILFKWRGKYSAIGSALDIWSALTTFDAESKNAVLGMAKSSDRFGGIMTELVEATKSGTYIRGVRVLKLPRSNTRRYEILYDTNVLTNLVPPAADSKLMEKLRARAARETKES
jgi:hypothetical protein